MSKKEKIKLIAFILLCGFCLAMYLSFILYDLYFDKFYWSKVSIFFDPHDKFNDFKHALLNQNIIDFEPYELSGRTIINGYFPFTYIFFRPIIFLSENQGFALFFTTFTFGLLYANYRFLRYEGASKVDNLQNIFIFSFLTYPFLFTIDRANIEGWILLMYIGFLIAYQKEKYNLAAIIIGTAAAIKFYPGMLAFFFLKDKKYRQFSLFVGFTSIVTIVSLIAFKGSLIENIQNLFFSLHTSELAFGIGFKEVSTSWADLIRISGEQQSNPVDMYGATAYMSGVKNSSSLLGFVKLIMIALHLENTISTNVVMHWYKISSLVIGSVLFVYLLKFENEKWKISMFLASYFVLFIYSSFDYKLLIFFIPLWLFINSNEKSKYDFVYCILLALIMVPKHFLISINNNISDSGALLNPALMLLICAMMVVENHKLKQRSFT